MENEKNYKYIIIVIIISICLFFSTAFFYIFGSNSARRQIDQLRGQLSEATESNNSLRGELESCRGELELCQSRFEQCHFILKELGDTTGRSIETVRDCINLVEEQRYYIACLAYYIDSGNSDELYNRIDDWLEHEGIEFIK